MPIIPQLQMNNWAQNNMPPGLGMSATPGAGLALVPQAPPNAAMNLQGQAAAPVVSPLTPAQAVDNAYRRTQQAGDVDQQAAQLKSDTEKGQANATFGGITQQQAQLAQQAADHQFAQQRMQHLEDRQNQDISNTMQQGIDPMRAWNNKSTGSKIMAGIGILLSGLGSGASAAGGHATSNAALDQINRAISNDIDAQKEDIANHYKGISARGILEDNEMNRSSHNEAWQNDYQMRSWKTVQALVQNIGDQSQSPMTQLAAKRADLLLGEKLDNLRGSKYNMLAQQAAQQRARGDMQDAKWQKAFDAAFAVSHDGQKAAHTANAQVPEVHKDPSGFLSGDQSSLPPGEVGDNSVMIGGKAVVVGKEKAKQYTNLVVPIHQGLATLDHIQETLKSNPVEGRRMVDAWNAEPLNVNNQIFLENSKVVGGVPGLHNLGSYNEATADTAISRTKRNLHNQLTGVQRAITGVDDSEQRISSQPDTPLPVVTSPQSPPVAAPATNYIPPFRGQGR